MKVNRYIMIADVGSTKAECALIDTSDCRIEKFTTRGLNAITANDEVVRLFLEEIAVFIPEGVNLSSVYYYGAGCATPEICRDMSLRISTFFHCENVHVESDLLCACRSLLGNASGIACILGTGSNSCLYDGKTIQDNVPSMGYILGDEGGGVALGKRLLGDFFKRLLPTEIHDALIEERHISMSEVLNSVYRSQTPNAYIASFVPFLKLHENNSYIRTLLYDGFLSFFQRNVSRYKNSKDYPICFTGGIAFNFENQLRKVAADLNYSIGEISNRPLDGLIDYHLKFN